MNETRACSPLSGTLATMPNGPEGEQTNGRIFGRRPKISSQAFRVVAALSLALVIAGCSSLSRNGVPEDQIDLAAPYGIKTYIRDWGDTLSETGAAALQAEIDALKDSPEVQKAKATGVPYEESVLLLSGGGPDGAFGAGLLNGWTARGDRPEFDIVTGISTGSIIAVFAFLGPDYDRPLREVYTQYTTDQLLEEQLLSGLFGGASVADASGFRAMIEQYVDDEMVSLLAAEYKKGRYLLVGTTNLDAQRPMIWDVTAIAGSGSPEAKNLIRDVIQASAAIPGVFPPVLIPVETADGSTRDELHVDGGATRQLIYFSPEFSMKRIDAALGIKINRTAWAIVNNKIEKPYKIVEPKLLPIVGASLGSLLGGSGQGDLYRAYAIAKRDDVDLKIMTIPRDFDVEPTEPFDPIYMNALYELGYQHGLANDTWLPHPPDFAEDVETGPIN